MMKTIFDPEGRLGPVAFREAAIFLIGIGAIISLLPWVEPSLFPWTFISFVLVYPWGVIWAKRFHDAGKSGWIFLAVLVLWLIIGGAIGYFVGEYLAPSPTTRATNFSAIMVDAAARAEALALPNTIVSAVISYVFVLVGNVLLKSDPGPNAYDPPSHMR